MKLLQKRTISLSAAEVNQAIRNYVTDNSTHSIPVPDKIEVFYVADDKGRYHSPLLEVVLLDEIEDL